MAPEITATIAALGGTLVGGLVNFLASRNAKNHEWKLALVRDRITERQNLYSEFLVSTQTLLMRSMEKKIQKPTELNVFNNEFARVELVGSKPVVEAARQVCDFVLVAHSPSAEAEQRSYFSLKQEFINAVRKELAALEDA